MTIKEALTLARETLVDNDIEDAPLECEILLRHVLNINRVQLYQDIDHQITPEQELAFWRLIERRINHEPTAYITGVREFYGLEFYVNESVLIPRPETELLVEKTIEIARNYKSPVIADIGTGCGNIAVSLAVNLPQSTVIATDISEKALIIAQRNCERHKVENRIQFILGNLLEPVKEQVDIIISNPPYVRTADLTTVNTSGYEPPLALDGGDDGLDVIRRLCAQINGKLKPGGSVLLEIGMGQKEEVFSLLKNLYPLEEVFVFPDLSNIDRVVYMKTR